MIALPQVYILTGAMFLSFAIVTLIYRRDWRRFGNAALWALLGVSFLFGDWIGDSANGVLAIAIVAVGGFGITGPDRGTESDRAAREAEAARRGNRLFVPALVIPAIALLGTVLFWNVPHVVKQGQETIVSLALGAITALLACMIWFRARPVAPLREGVRLMDGIGWDALLPQMLASLGTVFALAGMGKVLGDLIGYVPTGDNLFAQVALYATGMAILTALMGNALAAFPIMFAAMGGPMLIHEQGGDPAAVASIGMLAGFCGTLLTPMAANFNLVPAALLELRDSYGVIRAQVPTALAMLLANILLLYFLGFRH